MAGDTTTVARPYAEAVFERAQETGQLNAWSDALQLLAVIADDPLMAQQINNPNLLAEDLETLVLSVTADEGAALGEEQTNLARLLIKNERLAAAGEIARLFDERKAAAQGLHEVHIKSAYAVDAAQKKALADALQARFGGEIELTVEKDPALIGGLEIRAGDIVIDGSIRAKLHQLANDLQL